MRFWKPKPVPGEPLVGLGVAVYLNDDRKRLLPALQCFVASVRAQTYTNWRLHLVHDGPLSAEVGQKAVIELTRDARVVWAATPERRGHFGHPHRQATLEALTKTCAWVGLNNGDNYLAPVFLEWLLATALAAPAGGCDLVHCDMVRSHKGWKPFPTRPRRGQLDLGAFLVRSALAKQVKFDNFGFAGDGDWINRLMSRPAVRVRRVPAVLMVHN